MAEVNHYKVLGLDRTATADEIKATYRGLAKKWHPDRFPEGPEREEAEEKFQAFTEAYNILSDPNLRKRYDEGELDDKQVNLEDLDTHQQAKLFFANGVNLFREDRFAEAADYFSQAVKIQPEVAKYHAHVGEAYSRLPSKLKEAVVAYEKALEIEPYNYRWHISLGRIYRAAKMPIRAKKSFEEVLRWDDGNAVAMRELAQLDEEIDGGRKKGFLEGIVSALKKKR